MQTSKNEYKYKYYCSTKAQRSNQARSEYIERLCSRRKLAVKVTWKKFEEKSFIMFKIKVLIKADLRQNEG